MTKKKILLIIPAYNEQENILKTYNKIIKFNKENKTNYDVIVINDGSIDNTENILKENKIPHVSLVQNLGIGGAVQTGYKYAYDNNYDIAIQYDGDGQHDVSYVEKIIEPIINGEADLVTGSRFIDKSSSEFKSSLARRIGIYLISKLIKLVTKKRVYDITSGFRAGNKKVIEQFSKVYPVEYPEPITIVELLKKGFIIKEVPVKMHAREGGSSSIKTWKNAYYMFNVILSIIITGMRRYK